MDCHRTKLHIRRTPRIIPSASKAAALPFPGEVHILGALLIQPLIFILLRKNLKHKSLLIICKNVVLDLYGFENLGLESCRKMGILNVKPSSWGTKDAYRIHSCLGYRTILVFWWALQDKQPLARDCQWSVIFLVSSLIGWECADIGIRINVNECWDIIDT